MNFNKLYDLPESLNRLLDRNINFAIEPFSKGYALRVLTPSEFEESLNSFCLFIKKFHQELEIQDLAYMPESELKVVIGLHKILRKYLKVNESRSRKQKTLGSLFEELVSREKAISLGGKIPLEAVTKENLTFFTANAFHDLLLSMRIQIKYTWDQGVYVPCKIDENVLFDVPFRRIEKKKILGLGGVVKGYEFRIKDTLFFTTDSKLKLSDSYSLLCDGISLNSNLKSCEIPRTFRVNTIKEKKENSVEFQFHGNEVSILLKRDDGCHFSIGMKNQQIISPATSYTILPEYKVVKKCSRAKVDQVKQVIEIECRSLEESKNPKNLFLIVSELLELDPPPMKVSSSAKKMFFSLFMPVKIVSTSGEIGAFNKPVSANGSTNLIDSNCLDANKFKKQLLRELG